MKYLFLILVLSLASPSSFAHSGKHLKKGVNIVTWWDYLTSKSLEPVERACDVKIYFDEYYSNAEFQRKVEANDYDIAIYSDNISKDIRLLTTSIIDLKNEFLPSYPQSVRALSDSLDNNSAFFMFAFTGLLWNPDNISLSPTDGIRDIFSKAEDKLVLILDEHAVAFDLLRQAGLADSNPEQLHNLRKLLAGSYAVISSNLGRLYQADNFALAYVWSGEALSLISDENLNYQFLLHPSISHMAFDQLTLLDNSEASVCVARYLASEKFTKGVSERTKYFSPYSIDRVLSSSPVVPRKPLHLENSYFLKSQRVWASVKMSINPRMKVKP
ncbi:hypothetical protein [Endozoicomonas atrinae]|uniref:hypothetical protein n=1 Tax=Endozoicomonas atrinae TaxID=1333660 RepID=UPI003B00F595